MAAVRVETETEVPGGWVFTVRVGPAQSTADAGGGGGEHRVSLSWVDYEHWSHGMVPPERVAKAVVEAVLESGAVEPLPARFDAATARRWIPELDRIVRERV